MADPTTPSASFDLGRLQAEIDFISELSSVVAGSSELQPILDWMAPKTAGLLGADECSIRLMSADRSTTQTVVNMVRGGHEAGTSSWPPPLKNAVMGFLTICPGELSTTDILSDPRFPALRNVASPVRALLAVPLRVDGAVTGMLAVSQREPGHVWDAADAKLLSIVASHSAGVLEKARLRAEAEEKRRLQLEKEKIEKELLLAREIQMRLVPEQLLECGPWRADGRLVPARQVGGDYYDYFPIEGGRFAVALADVSGKGVPAALLVSTVQGTLRAFCDGRRPPREVIRELNRAVVRHAGSGRFVTLFYAELDPRTWELRYVNAGHNYPLLRRAGGEIERLETGGVPLGLFEDAQYEESVIPFGDRDGLLLFSDGITEAMDVLQAEYGDDRLAALWETHPLDGPGEFTARLISDVALFRGAAAQSDDITVVVVGRRPEV
ncbi:MAG: SpoIIE family protein phosphatase [Candidatus Eisenbacteria bacterium]|nr:SpoIIE family protein phosphatase [Candidatus Eisenbacteria bacterium]